MKAPPVFIAAALAGLLVSSSAQAAEDDPSSDEDGLVWREEWMRFHWGEYVATGAMLGGVAVGLLAVPQRTDQWSGGILTDDWLRDRMVLGGNGPRQTATTVGDAFYYGLWAYPVVVDVGVAALLAQQSPDVALQMFLIDAQAFAFTGLVSTLTQRLVGRDRPFLPECANDPDYDDECDDEVDRSQGFISGHTAIAFTGASLVCSHHAHLRLYGDRAADMIACSTAMLGATISGLSRVVGDRHYMSDVMAAAAVGVISGYLMPELLHYRTFWPQTSGAWGKATLVPTQVGADGWGLALGGSL